MEPGQYLDGNAESRERGRYRRGAFKSWKAESFGGGFGREQDAWQWDNWRAGRHGSMDWFVEGMEPRQYLDGNAESLERGRYRYGAFKSWKAEGFGDSFG